MSGGLRFTTLPDATPPSAQTLSSEADPSSCPLPSQPPTTITAIFNPIVGHISSAYAARVSRDLSLCSRFDFNVYSYESEWSLGAEWWTRRKQTKNTAPPVVPDLSSPTMPLLVAPIEPPSDTMTDPVQGVVKARVSTTGVSRVCFSYPFVAHVLPSRTYPLCGKVEYEICSLASASPPTSLAVRHPYELWDLNFRTLAPANFVTLTPHIISPA